MAIPVELDLAKSSWKKLRASPSPLECESLGQLVGWDLVSSKLKCKMLVYE